MKKELPHHNVYARLAVSDIHGVGVKAIRFIKKDQEIFHGDDNKSQWILAGSLGAVPKWAFRLYNDFTVCRRDYYGCPINFNRLTPACYLNHSEQPNVAFDRVRGFYALRNIKTDEELTVDYRKFSKLYSDKKGGDKKQMKHVRLAIAAAMMVGAIAITPIPEMTMRLAPKTKQPCPPACGQIEPLFAGQQAPAAPRPARSPAAKPVPPVKVVSRNVATRQM